MKFFKFVSDKNISSDEIKYEVGKKIEIQDVNIDKNQYNNGIHCIAWKGNSPINSNMFLGPRVAILKAKKEDVVSKSENGTCYLKRCKVVDIINTEDLPDDIKTGRKSYEFFMKFLSNINSIQHKQEYLNLILENCFDYYLANKANLYFEKLDRYYPEVEEYLLSKKMYDNAICYAICKGKYINPIIRDKIFEYHYDCHNYNLKYSKFGWAKVFPRDEEEIEKLMDSPEKILLYCETMGYKNEEAAKFTEKMAKIQSINYFTEYVLRIGTNEKLEKDFLRTGSLGEIICYAIRYNKNTKEIRDAILKYEVCYEYEDFVKGILEGKDIKDIALLSPKLACQHILLRGEPTPEIKDKIKEAPNYSSEYSDIDNLEVLWNFYKTLV